MPKGHPRCPDCHGAGGRMARTKGRQTRWVRCKCVPNHIDDNTRRQALGRVAELFEHNNADPVRLNIALDVVMFTGVGEMQCIATLANTLTAACYNGNEVERRVHDHYSKDDDNADTRGDASSSSTDSSSG